MASHGGITLGRIGGIRIGLDYSWFIIFALIAFLLASAYLPLVAPGMTALAYWSSAVMVALLFFASVLFHELSHAFIARRAGIPVNNIVLFIFGGMAQMEDEPGSPWDEFKMAIAGPLASVLIAVVFFGVALAAAVAENRLLLASFNYLWFINLVLAVFNMLPGFPLDGGRVFRAGLWKLTGSLRRATWIAALTGQGFGWLLIALGVGSLVYPPLRAFASIWFALIGWFLVSAARNSYQQTVLKETLARVPVADVMNPEVTAVPPALSVQRLVTDYFLRESASSFPVEHDGAIIGMVAVEDVRALPREEWERRVVADIMRPLAEERVLHPEDDAWDAASRMAKHNADSVFVTADGRMAGIVTRATIARWLQTHATWAPGPA
ncbi:MAG TPA: site-2 protease family protein [Armatimonadota bacterium]|nr:site-2 protease family protein [Armatimonadota bacterium]HOS42270.1 site-2 protease family protein [Armatimonadota bacterium]